MAVIARTLREHYGRAARRRCVASHTFRNGAATPFFDYCLLLSTANSESVRVTESGAETITNFPRELFDCPAEA